MRNYRIPTAVEMMGLPAGDRIARLMSLARWYRERGAALDAIGSTAGATRCRNNLERVRALAEQIGCCIA